MNYNIVSVGLGYENNVAGRPSMMGDNLRLASQSVYEYESGSCLRWVSGVSVNNRLSRSMSERT